MSLVYSNNFEAETVGALPANWINTASAAWTISSTTPLKGTKSLAFSTSADGQVAIYNGQSTLTNQDVTYVTRNVNSTDCTGPIVRDDGTGNNHYLTLINASALVIYKRTAGAYAQIATANHGLTISNATVRVRFQATGTTLQSRLWIDGQAEPVTWMVVTTDTAYTVGSQGIRSENGSTSLTQAIVDEFAVDNMVTVSAATSYTLTGPASGTTNSISSVFTVTPNGTYTGVVTPATTGTGTFTPTSVSWSATAGAQTFTYTPTTSVTATISATSSPALTNPSSVTYVSSLPGAALIIANDTNVVYSPYTWYANGTDMQTVNAGAYFRCSATLSATANLTLNINTSTYGSLGDAIRPVLAYSIDGAQIITLIITAANLTGTSPNQSVTLVTGLTLGTHTIQVWLKNLSSTTDNWTPVEQLRVQSMQVSTGTLSSVPGQAVLTKKALFYGDSLTEGEGVDGLSSSNFQAFNNARANWPSIVANQLSAEYGQVGFAGTGWTTVGASSAPGLSTNWNFYYSGVSRLSAGAFINGAPDYVFINMGTNGNSAGAAGVVQAFLASLRTASGASSQIFLMIPFGQYALAGLVSEFNNYQTATPDANCFLINLGAAAAVGISTGQNTIGNIYSFDNIHPNALKYALLAAQVTAAVIATTQPTVAQIASAVWSRSQRTVTG